MARVFREVHGWCGVDRPRQLIKVKIPGGGELSVARHASGAVGAFQSINS